MYNTQIIGNINVIFLHKNDFLKQLIFWNGFLSVSFFLWPGIKRKGIFIIILNTT